MNENVDSLGKVLWNIFLILVGLALIYGMFWVILDL